MRDPKRSRNALGTRSPHSCGPRPLAPARTEAAPEHALWPRGRGGLPDSCLPRVPDEHPSRVGDLRQSPGPRAVGFEDLLKTHPRKGN